MRSCHLLKLFIKFERTSTTYTELAKYGLYFVPEEKKFLYPLFETKVPQSWFPPKVRRVTRKLKGKGKIFMSIHQAQRYK